jgi:hypothetical protein
VAARTKTIANANPVVKDETRFTVYPLWMFAGFTLFATEVGKGTRALDYQTQVRKTGFSRERPQPGRALASPEAAYRIYIPLKKRHLLLEVRSSTNLWRSLTRR